MWKSLSSALLAFAVPLSAHAWKVSDMWWNDTESGWGLNIVQQGAKLFSTFFVYGTDNKATFFVAPDSTCATTNGVRSCAGLLYQTTGPAFSAATFNSASVANRQVGNFSITFPTVSTANLTYTVDGATVQKSLKRFNVTTRSLTGTFYGAYVTRISNCTNSANNQGEGAGFYQYIFTPSPDNATTGNFGWVENSISGLVCTHTGTYTQEGSVYRILTSFSCNNGSRGTQTSSALDFSDEGFKGLVKIDYTDGSGCIETGSISATRAVDNGN